MKLVEPLRMLADKSGGQTWFPSSGAEFHKVVKEIVQEIQNRYRLVYEPRIKPDGQFHEVRVVAFRGTADHPRPFDVRVRDGWRF